ncbi:oxidoreductase subunit [Shigella sonnei]|nr:oxidoreductase subunit [Shigella sonnei]SIZ63655.1 oxidoreductase subunit [Shigella sonnei]
MRKFTLNIFTLSLGLAVMPMVEAAPTAQQQLLEQVRLGEATHREDLVQQSLYRLELIDPNNPDVVAARFRSLLRQGDIDGAQKQLDRLSQLAPSSNAYKSSRTTMLLSTPDGRQALQQARLQATTGHAEEAVASYNKLFNGAPPEGDIAVEYWSTVAKIPARRGEAINQLKRINADAPGNTGLQNNLALLLFSSDRRDEGFAVLEQMAKSNAGREGASKIWYGQIKDMPELQQAVRANPKDSEALGALGQAYSQKGDRANAVANLEKALALDPHSSNNDKWNSLLKVNRYWLAIQQGDAALKANNPDRAERLFQQARNVDNTDSYAVLGLGDVAMARKDYPAAERYYQQTLRMDSGNTNAVRGLANIYRQQSPEKAEAFIASLSASQRRSIDDIERSLQNDRLAQQAEALENQGKWAQAAALQRQRLALDPGSVWITYRLSQDLWQAGQRSQADTLMRNLAQQKSNDPEQVYAYGLYLRLRAVPLWS